MIYSRFECDVIVRVLAECFCLISSCRISQKRSSVVEIRAQCQNLKTLPLTRFITSQEPFLLSLYSVRLAPIFPVIILAGLKCVVGAKTS